MLCSLAAFAMLVVPPQSHPTPEELISLLLNKGMSELGAQRMLTELTTKVGQRISGSEGAGRGVEWTKAQMTAMGFQNVREVACMAPRWVRGNRENAKMSTGYGWSKLTICALGGSVGTTGLEAEVIEVKSLDEAAKLGEKGRGKIVFFNRPMDSSLPSTGAAYGGAVDQRVGGASAAAKSGAVAVLVRSVTLANDDAPHTGTMRYQDGVDKIPAAALGIQSAERLSAALKRGPVRVQLELSCKSLPNVPSASVIGEIVGSEKPDEVILMGGHLDSWDLGQGAHDNGTGVTHALEAVRLIKELGLKPKRTIRAIGYMDEEQTGTGSRAYLAFAKASGQKHYAAIESDAGGFMPRAFRVGEAHLEAVKKWEPYLQSFGIERFKVGGSGADTSNLAELGTILFGFEPENQRYFDYHHSRNDTIDKVNPREHEFGALAIAMLAWLLSEEGV